MPLSLSPFDIAALQNDLSNLANIMLRMCGIFNLVIARGGELRLSFMLWRTNALLVSSSFPGHRKGDLDMKNGGGLVEKKKEEGMVGCLSCASYHEAYKTSKRKIRQLQNALHDVNSLSESTSHFILSASSAVFESNATIAARNI